MGQWAKWLWACALLGGVGWAAVSPVHHRTLSNGLQVYVYEDHRAPVVLTSVWYRVGGCDEHNGETGISHFLEHMMFRGTKRYPHFDKMIYQQGGRANAFTSQDMTVYHETLPVRALALSLRLEADRMQHLRIQPKAFQKEKQVVLEERRMRYLDQPQAQAWLDLHALAFVNNPYHHPVIGWKSDIIHLTRANLMRWYRRWYTPNNAVLIVVGDVQASRVFALAQQAFGAVPSHPVPQLKPRVQAPLLGQKQQWLRGRAKAPWLLMGFNVPTATTAKPWRAYALTVLADALVGGDVGLLDDALVRQQKSAVSVGSYYAPYGLHPGLFILYATPAPGIPLPNLKQRILYGLHRIQAKGIDPAQLKQIKTRVASHRIFARDSLMGEARDVGVPLMSGMPFEGNNAFVKAMGRVTSEQVQAVARDYFQPRNESVVLVLPQHTQRQAAKPQKEKA